MEKQKVNHIAVVVAVVAQQVLGAIWYSDVLFGRLWLYVIGKDLTHVQALGGFPYIVAILSSFIIAYFLVWLIQLTETHCIKTGIKLAFLAWCGVAVPVTTTHYIFQGQLAPLVYIDLGHSLVGFIVAATIITAWQKS